MSSFLKKNKNLRREKKIKMLTRLGELGASKKHVNLKEVTDSIDFEDPESVEMAHILMNLSHAQKTSLGESTSAAVSQASAAASKAAKRLASFANKEKSESALSATQDDSHLLIDESTTESPTAIDVNIQHFIKLEEERFNLEEQKADLNPAIKQQLDKVTKELNNIKVALTRRLAAKVKVDRKKFQNKGKPSSIIAEKALKKASWCHQLLQSEAANLPIQESIDELSSEQLLILRCLTHSASARAADALDSVKTKLIKKPETTKKMDVSETTLRSFLQEELARNSYNFGSSQVKPSTTISAQKLAITNILNDKKIAGFEQAEVFLLTNEQMPTLTTTAKEATTEEATAEEAAAEKSVEEAKAEEALRSRALVNKAPPVPRRKTKPGESAPEYIRKQ